MVDVEMISKCSSDTKTGGWQPGRKIAAVAVLIVMSLTVSACSTLKGSSEGTWDASYFTDPDRVWGAIEIALIDLDYDVETKNRPDGVIRATSAPADDGTIIALAIDQVMNTEDQVRIYVKPSFGGDEGTNNPDLLEAAADQFLKAVRNTLEE